MHAKIQVTNNVEIATCVIFIEVSNITTSELITYLITGYSVTCILNTFVYII